MSLGPVPDPRETAVNQPANFVSRIFIFGEVLKIIFKIIVEKIYFVLPFLIFFEFVFPPRIVLD